MCIYTISDGRRNLFCVLEVTDVCARIVEWVVFMRRSGLV
jgi:hypothetical protein